MSDRWATDEWLMSDWWATDERLMSDWWATDERLMSDWWATDERLMSDWWATDERLMSNWWATDEWLINDDLLMIRGFDHGRTDVRTHGRTTLVVKSLSRLKMSEIKIILNFWFKLDPPSPIWRMSLNRLFFFLNSPLRERSFIIFFDWRLLGYYSLKCCSNHI